MLKQIHAIQVPNFWEVIKYAAIKADKIKEEDTSLYAINLLQDLLGGKKVCFVIMDKNNKVTLSLITEFKLKEITKEKYLFLNNLYSFNLQEADTWKIALDDLVKIAEINKCKFIMGETNIQRLGDLVISVGAVCTSKKYVFYI